MKMEKGKAIGYAKNLVTYTSASLIPMLLNLIANPFIAKNMSPEDYAITGYFTSFNTLISPIIIFYLIHYYTKSYFTLDEEGRLKLKATIFKALIFFSFGIAMLCFIAIAVYMTASSASRQFPIFPYLLMTVFAIPLTGIYTLEQTDFKMQRKSRSFFRLSTINGVSLVALNLILIVALKWGAFGRLLAPLAINLSMFIYLAVKHREYFRISFDYGYFKEILKFCLPLTASAMLGYFFNGFDKTYLESLGNVNEYGIYIVGAQMAGFLTTFSTAISATFQPDMYKAIAKNDNRQFLKVSGMTIGLVAITVAAFIIFAPFIVDILTMGRYTAAAPYARILALSTITSTIYYATNNYTIAKGYPRLYLYTTIIGSISMMALVPAATARWEFNGAAAAVVLSYIILTAVNFILLAIRRFFGCAQNDKRGNDKKETFTEKMTE